MKKLPPRSLSILIAFINTLIATIVMLANEKNLHSEQIILILFSVILLFVFNYFLCYFYFTKLHLLGNQ